MPSNSNQADNGGTNQHAYQEAIIVLLLQILDQSDSSAEAKAKAKEKVAVLLAGVMPNARAARLVGMQNSRLYDAVKKVKL